MKNLACFELAFATEVGVGAREGNLVYRVIICQGVEIAQRIASAMVGEEDTVPARFRLTRVHRVESSEKFPNIYSEDDNKTWARALKKLAITDQEKVMFLYITRISGKTEKVGVFFTPRQLREMFPEGEFTCSLD